MTLTKDRKTNITGYLSIKVIEALETLARESKLSRNNLLEEAILDFLEKKKAQV